MAIGPSVMPCEPEDGLASLKTQFLASLNHELRTPLTGILGMTDLLAETALDEEQRDYLSAIRTCADELLALFDKTLEYSDLASGLVVLVRQEFHLPESVRAAVNEQLPRARAKGLRLVCRVAPNLPEVAIGDGPRLQRIVTHMVENAVKFTEQGKVEVEAGGEATGGRLDLRLDVCDTGIGIASERLARAFEPFRQLDGGLARAHSGLGLGLSLVEKLTALMGGAVSVESTPGRGSRFSVTLPLDLPVEASASHRG